MIDLHCDTILRLYSEKPEGNLLDTDCSVSIRQLEKIKALAQCFAIYTPPGDGRWQTMKDIYQRFCLEIERNSSFICHIHLTVIDEELCIFISNNICFLQCSL